MVEILLIQKKCFLLSLLLSIISILVYFFINISDVKNIFLAIFGSSFLVTGVSLISYCFERQQLLIKVLKDFLYSTLNEDFVSLFSDLKKIAKIEYKYEISKNNLENKDVNK